MSTSRHLVLCPFYFHIAKESEFGCNHLMTLQYITVFPAAWVAAWPWGRTSPCWVLTSLGILLGFKSWLYQPFSKLQDQLIMNHYYYLSLILLAIALEAWPGHTGANVGVLRTSCLNWRPVQFKSNCLILGFQSHEQPDPLPRSLAVPRQALQADTGVEMSWVDSPALKCIFYWLH